MRTSPSKKQSKDRVRLFVKAADNATEIFLVDSEFQRIDKAVGMLETAVVPGLYKVRFRSGQRQVDRLIEVDEGEDLKTVNGPAIALTTAAPINRDLSQVSTDWGSKAQVSTDQISNYKTHQDAARELSRSVRLKRGSGSWVYLFARDRTPEPTATTAAHPWQGVSLHTLDGTLLATLSEGERDSQNTFCGLSMAINPGTYRLRVQVDVLETYEMFVVAVEGWQTQVFMVVDNFSPMGGQVRRASLPTASIFMSPGRAGFDPLSQSVREVELVRLGLVSARDVLMRQEVTRLLETRSLNPMLGILGAHLLMRQRHLESALVGDIIHQLGDAFAAHPDIQALLLYPEIAPAGSPCTPAGSPFLTPPMLRASWQCVVRASREHPGVVPPGGLIDQVADGLLYTAPWLIHRLAISAPAPLPTITLAEANQQVQTLLALPAEQKAGLKRDLETLQSAKQFTALEQNILNATVFRVVIPSIEEIDSLEEIETSASSNEMPSLQTLLDTIDAPTGTIARAIHSILHKLNSC